MVSEMNHHDPIYVPDSSIIQALKYQQPHEKLEFIASRLGIPFNKLCYRIKMLRKAGKIPKTLKTKPKTYKANHPTKHRTNSDFKVVETISKKRIAELLQKGIDTDELAKTIDQRTANCDCDMYDLRIGGEY